MGDKERSETAPQPPEKSPFIIKLVDAFSELQAVKWTFNLSQFFMLNSLQDSSGASGQAS